MFDLILCIHNSFIIISIINTLHQLVLNRPVRHRLIVRSKFFHLVYIWNLFWFILLLWKNCELPLSYLEKKFISLKPLRDKINRNAQHVYMSARTICSVIEAMLMFDLGWYENDMFKCGYHSVGYECITVCNYWFQCSKL